MMNRKEFYEYVKDNVKEYLPESYKDAEIKLQEVEKNNGLKITVITIPNGDQRIVPTVYLDSLYQDYINGKDVDSCVGDVADMRIEAQGKAEFFDMGVPDILDYEKMKDKLQVRICDKEWNTDRLADKVVTEHGDFAAYYAVNLEENEEEISSIPVTVSLMNEWGVSVEQIQADAMMADKNRGVQLVDMTQIVESMIFGGTPKNLLNEKLDMETVENPMFCLTNESMTADLLSKIKSGKSEIIDFLNEHGNLQFVRNTKGRYEKFPLTDIQNSYVVGRNTMYELGGVACHGYIEMSFDKVLDIKRLEIAWNKVIQKHDMLRAIVSNSGYQIVQEAVPYVTIQCLDLRITEGNNETDKNDFRRRLANKQYELGKWPMCDLALTVENEKSIIHLSLDMLIADFVSTNIILHDLETFYENPDLIIVPTTLYRDVVLYQNQKRTIKTVERNVAEKYWSDKIPSMGEAPDLPLKDDYALDNAKFTQKKVFLNHDMWMSFVENARKFKVTPSILIMASFAEVLGLWSSNNKFCINTTILNRPDVTQDVNKIVGDFTDVNVTAIALDFSKNFIERARTIQNDLWVDLEHNAFSGVEVLRKMTKDRKKNIIIPVVYTSTVGMAADDDMTVKNPITYKISQTPQVYIDCQAAEENNGCTINWDVREGVFDDFIIEAMFESFKELLLSSCETLNNRFEEKQPVYLPSDMRSVREKINDTKESISPYMMMGLTGGMVSFVWSVLFWPSLFSLRASTAKQRKKCTVFRPPRRT